MINLINYQIFDNLINYQFFDNLMNYQNFDNNKIDQILINESNI